MYRFLLMAGNYIIFIILQSIRYIRTGIYIPKYIKFLNSDQCQQNKLSYCYIETPNQHKSDTPSYIYTYTYLYMITITYNYYLLWQFGHLYMNK